jgi:hypothetical protein
VIGERCEVAAPFGKELASFFGGTIGNVARAERLADISTAINFDRSHLVLVVIMK